MSPKNRRRIQLFVIALLIAVGVTILAFKESEPMYQGKSLTHWLRDLDVGLPQKQKEKAKEALASIGVGALPVLDKMLNGRESAGERITQWAYSLPFVEPTNFTFPVTTVREKQQRALRGYAVLGTKAIPSLIRALNHEEDWIRDSAASGLGDLGARAVDAVPALIRIMERQESMSAVRALGKIGPAAKEAIPRLTQAMHDGDLQYRVCVADALVQIDPSLKETELAINEILTEGENLARQQGIPSAQEALTKKF